MFKSKPQPCTQRVHCSITTALEKSTVAFTHPNRKGQKTSCTHTQAVKAQSQAIANLIGAADITSDVVGKVVCALQDIDRDLRTTGFSLIDGLTKIVLVDGKARSAQYVKLNGRTVLLQARGHIREYTGEYNGRGCSVESVCLCEAALVLFFFGVSFPSSGTLGTAA